MAARPHRRQVRRRWSIVETNVKVADVLCIVFRALDDLGRVVDASVSATRDAAAAPAVSETTPSEQVEEDTVTLTNASTTCGAVTTVTRGRRDAVTISDEGTTQGGMEYALTWRRPNEIAQIAHLDA